MEPQDRYEGTIDYVHSHWPGYLIGYGGGTLLILVAVWLGFARDWYGLVPLAAALMLVLAYFFGSSLWAANRLYDENRLRDLVVKIGRIEPSDNIVHLGLGRRQLPIALSRRLLDGRVTVIDIYNPQLTPDRSLARRQQRLSHPPTPDDPRLEWLGGHLTLLPVPDGSADVVTMVETISKFWQHGDRVRLMQEIRRILAPGGRLVLAERLRNPANLTVMGPGALRLQPATYWQQLLIESGFQIMRREGINDLIYCYRADKPLPGMARQMVFEF